MATYKVLVSFEADGKEVEVGSEIEMSPKAAKELVKDGTLELVEASKPSKPKVDEDKTVVIDASGAHVRTYSVDDHGDDHADLAAQFVEKNKSKGYAVKK